MRFRIVFALLIACFASIFVEAQDSNPSIISIQGADTELQTGREYVFTVQVDNPDSLWLTSFEIIYDPQHLYLMGSVSANAVSIGNVFDPVNSVHIMNQVSEGKITQVISQLAPAEAINTGGVLARLRFYPLMAGETQLRFESAELTTVHFTNNPDGTRSASAPETNNASVNLLTLTITGETVEAPSEATAVPTAIPTEFSPIIDNPQPNESPLEVVEIPTNSPDGMMSQTSPASDDSFLMILAIGMILSSLIGLTIVFFILRLKNSKS